MTTAGRTTDAASAVRIEVHGAMQGVGFRPFVYRLATNLGLRGDVRNAGGHVLIVLGACATAGGIQALRNFADVEEFTSVVYAQPQYISTLATSTAIADHVPVDYELRGCPIDRDQLLEVLSAFLVGRKPDLPNDSVCTSCKRRGIT